MKKSSVIIIILLSLSLWAGNTAISFETGNEQEVYVMFDMNFDAINIMEPSAGLLRVNVPDDVLTVSLISMNDSLMNVYAVTKKGKPVINALKTKADIFSEYGITDSAMYYYDLEFKNNDDLETYQAFIDAAQAAYPDSLISIMEQYSNKYPKRLNVVFVNALKYSKLGDEGKFKELLVSGTKKREKSEGYFYLTLYRLFYDDNYSKEDKANDIEYIIRNFPLNPDIYYFVDEALQVRNDKNAKKIDSAVKVLAGKEIGSEAKLSCAVYFTDSNIELKKAVDLFENVLKSGDMDAEGYTGYINYYMADAYYRQADMDKAAEMLNIAEKTFDYKDMKYFTLSMKIHSHFNDTDAVIIDAGNMLTLSTDVSSILQNLSQCIDTSEGVVMQVKNAGDSVLMKEMLDYDYKEFIYADMKGDSVRIPGKGITFIDFFATWCGPCGMTMPHIVNLEKIYRGKVEFLAITREDEETDLKGYINEKSIEFPVIMKGDNIVNEFKVRGIPSLFVVNPEKGKMFNVIGYTESIEDVLSIRINYMMSLE